MTNIFTAKKMRVPGLLPDDALQEQLKQYTTQQRLQQGSAPPPTSAVDFADKVARDFISNPPPAVRDAARRQTQAVQGTLPPVPPAERRAAQDEAIERRSDIAAQFPGPVNRVLTQMGTLSAEESEAATAERAEDLKQQEEAFRAKAEIRSRLRGLTDEQAAEMGLPVAPGGTPLEAKGQGLLTDLSTLQSVAERREEAEAAVRGEPGAPKVTQTWWLNALQTAQRNAAQTGTSALRTPVILLEEATDLLGRDPGRSDMRAWIDTVDRSLDKMLPGDKARAKDFMTELSAGSGSMAAFMLAGFISTAVGLPPGVAAGTLGALSQSAQMYEEAEQFGATALQKYIALIAGAGLGMTEAIPIDRMFMRADRATGGLVRRLLLSTSAGGLEEFIQEVSQALGEDVVAKYLAGFDPDREIDVRDILRRGAVGAITGGVAGGAVQAADDVARGRQAAPAGPEQVAEREAVVQGAIADAQTILNRIEGFSDDSLMLPLAETTRPDIATEVGVPEERPPVPAPLYMRADTPAGGVGLQIEQTPDGGLQLRAGQAEQMEADIQRLQEQTAATTYRGGTPPQLNEQGKVELTHWSPAPRAVLDPAMQGTGPLRGPERQRLFGPNAVNRTYYGVQATTEAERAAARPTLKEFTKRYDEQNPPPAKMTASEKRMRKVDIERAYFAQDETAGYAREAGLGGFRHTVQVDPNDLYNWYEDPQNLRAQVDRSLTNMEQVTQYERLIRDAGFRGVYYNRSPLGQTAMLFDKAEPTAIVDDRTGEPVDFSQNEGLLAMTSAEAKRKLGDAVPGIKGVLKYMTPDERAKLRRDTAQKIVDLFTQLPPPKEMAAVAIAGRAKRGWYARSAKALVDIFGLQDAPRFAALLAALSPQTSVENNAVNALNMWVNWDAAGRPLDRPSIERLLGKSVQGGKGAGSVLPAWIPNTVTALTTTDPLAIELSGPKVSSFMKNLQGVTVEVTNDTWMANFANVPQALFKKTGQSPGKGPGYIAFNTLVRRAAAIASKLTGEQWTPAEVQETVWSWTKALYEKVDSAGETRSAVEIVRAAGLTDAEIAATPDFATLFQEGIYRNILEKGGYDVPIDEGSLGADDAAGQEGAGAAGEGAAPAAGDLAPLLERAARRLDQLRSGQIEQAGEVVDEIPFFEDVPRRDDLSWMTEQDFEDLLGQRGPIELDAADLQPLPGLPKNSTGPIESVVRAARAYAESRGMPLRRQKEYVRVDPERGARIAAEYDRMEDNPNDPAVAAAYEALVEETLAQYQFVKASGLQIEFIEAGQPDPYPEGPKQVLADLQRGHLWVFPTEQGFGTLTEAQAANPLLRPTDEFIGERQLLVNDVFRIVHDFFGHGLEGAGFGARGEENAWQAHMRLFSEKAIPAMTSETRGQNSWVNFGPYGEQNRANQRETIYADQKTGLMPEWTWREGVEDDVATPADFLPLDPSVFKKPGWAIVTAMKEDAGDHTSPENAEALERMRKEFEGTDAIEIEGAYKGVPQGASWVIFADEATALEIGRRYGQESILTNRGLVYTDGRLVPSVPADTVVGDAARQLDFYSTLPDGTSFSVGLDFENIQQPELAARAVTETPEFKAWFGDSKVVDENGEPLVVYHGTGADFSAFDVEGITADAAFFAEDPDVANLFASFEDSPRVYPVYLSAKNPMDVDFADVVDENGDFLQEEMIGAVEAAKARGYDSLRIANVVERPGMPPSTQWAVFASTQIKSVNNVGEFDPTNPDILAARATGTSAARPTYKGEATRPATGIPLAPNAEPNDANLAQISRNFIQLLNLTARQGRFTLKGRDVMGQYSRRQAVARLRTWNDLSTLVHEGGHALHDMRAKSLAAFTTANEAALMDVADKLYGQGTLSTAQLSRADHVREGFAELFRVYTLNRQYAFREFPQLTADFDQLLRTEAPDIHTGLEAIGQQFAAYLQLPSVQALGNTIVDGRREIGINGAIQELRQVGFRTWMSEYARRAVQTSVNRYAALNSVVAEMLNVGQENLGRAIDLKRAEDPRTLVRLAPHAGSRAMVQITDGVMAYKGLEPTTRGLRDGIMVSQGLDPKASPRAFDEERLKDFETYLVALRALDEYRRYDEGKLSRPPINLGIGDVRQTVVDLTAKYGESFEKGAQIVNEFARALWKKQYDAGLMSREIYKQGLDRQFYVPLQRDMSDKASDFAPTALTGGRSLVRRFRGSDRQIVSPLSVLMHKTFALEQTIAQNDVAKALAQLADRAGSVGALVERVPATQLVGRMLSVEDVAKQLTKDDSITPADAQDLLTILAASIENGNYMTMFRAEQASDKGENILFFWENGKVQAIQLKDGDVGADIVNMLNGLGRENMSLGMELIAGTSTLFRTAITSWPDFLIVNFIRDQMSAWILTDVGFKPFATGLRGVGDEIRQRDWARKANASMMLMGGMNVAALHEARVNRDIDALRSKGYVARVFSEGGVMGAIKGFGRIVELTETGTRMGLFRNAYERAKRDGLTDWEAGIEAAYIATDYIDFGLNGSRMLMWRRTIPFLNAQLQGYYKMLRTLGADEVRQRRGLKFALAAFFKSTKNMELSRTEKQAINTGRKAWAKMVSLGMLSALLHFLFEDDEDYQETSEYLRTTGWVVPVGDGRVFYIPKPFELALIANAVERALESAAGDTEAKRRFMRGAAMTMVPPTSPPAIQTVVEFVANKDFFTGREIVPSYMQALAPELQYNNYTSSLAKEIGSITGWSPMVIDHFLSGMGASAYRDMVTMTNALDPNRPTMDATDAPIARRFVRDVRRGSASSRDFWAQASMTDGKLRRGEVTYRSYLESGNQSAADRYLATLSDDEKAYALLGAHFKAEHKRLNPMYRARQINTVVSAMRRELVSDLGLENTTKFADERTIPLSPTQKAELDELLSEYARREMRNTMVALDLPGWDNKAPLDTAKTLDMLEQVVPMAREELERRLAKAKVYDAQTVFETWPEARDRLIIDRDEAFLDDLVAIAKVVR